ncbi:hypothetical protein SAMN05443247_09616 [Bradyrhizobium erythrophlei]|nr:hypothetical protein SAMN05443247_09616 [Bradyrhizobium erythrophlei]
MKLSAAYPQAQKRESGLFDSDLLRTNSQASYPQKKKKPTEREPVGAIAEPIGPQPTLRFSADVLPRFSFSS